MLDIDLFREEKGNDSDIIRESQRRRFFKVELVDEVIRLDKDQISQNKIDGEGASDAQGNKKLSAGKDNSVLEKLNSKLKLIGNIVHDSVPISNDEADNVVIRSWGEKLGKRGLKNHVELLGIADTKRGSKVSGNRGYYLKGDGVFLCRALKIYGLHFLSKRGYTAMEPPYFMSEDIMGKCAQLAESDEELYKISDEGGDKYLIATAEQPLCAYPLDEWMNPSELPIRYAGFSSCFRTEAGSHGRDTNGLFRIHEFTKIEQFCITSPKDNMSWDMHEEMIKNC